MNETSLSAAAIGAESERCPVPFVRISRKRQANIAQAKTKTEDSYLSSCQNTEPTCPMVTSCAGQAIGEDEIFLRLVGDRIHSLDPEH